MVDGITFDVSWPTALALLALGAGLVSVGLAHVVDVWRRERAG